MTTIEGAPPIRTEGLTKHYGDVKALVDLDLEVQRGEVFGFLGPNGAGKTTTIRSLLHFVFPTSGTASVLGMDVATNAVEIRSRVAYMPSEYSLYPKLTGAENLTYLANLRGGVDQAYVISLAERLEVDLTRKVSDLSTGNKQKVGLIQAFMSKSELVVLDEPSTGLDPLMQQELQAMIREVREDGSHRLPVEPQPGRSRARRGPGGHPAQRPPGGGRACGRTEAQGHSSHRPRVRRAGRGNRV